MGMFQAAASNATGWHTMLQVNTTRPSKSAISDHASTAALKPSFEREQNTFVGESHHSSAL